MRTTSLPGKRNHCREGRSYATRASQVIDTPLLPKGLEDLSVVCAGGTGRDVVSRPGTCGNQGYNMSFMMAFSCDRASRCVLLPQAREGCSRGASGWRSPGSTTGHRSPPHAASLPDRGRPLSLPPPLRLSVWRCRLATVAGPTPLLRELLRTTAVWHSWCRPRGRATRIH